MLRRLFSSSIPSLAPSTPAASPTHFKLNASQWSFFQRSFPSLLQSDQVSESQLVQLLHSPTAELIAHGRAVIIEAADAYLHRRFPKLKELYSLAGLNEKFFGAQSNLRQLSRLLGLESFDTTSRAIGSKRTGSRATESKTTGSRAADSRATDRLLALVGFLEQQLGTQSAHSWLQSRYLSNALFSATSLLPSSLIAYPIPHLTSLQRIKSGDLAAELEFRLHQESGRCSNDSMYVVGVYSPGAGEMLGEGAGPSIAMAQRRAALDALKRIYLKENMTARPSSPTGTLTTPSPTKSASPSRSSPTKSPTKQPPKLPSSPLAATSTSASTFANANASANRPSAEDLIDLERELHRLIARKSAAEANLASLEGRLYDLETEYLTETAQFGNLIVGLEGYLGLPPANTAASNATTNVAQPRRNAFASGVANIAAVLTGGGFPLSQRLISTTSTTFPASLAALGRREEAVACGYDPETTASSTGTSNALKKKISTTNSSTKVVKQTSPSKKSTSHKKTSENWTPPPMKSRKK